MSTNLDGAGRKLFILDTNVLLHDPMCLFKFKEHDLYIPIITLEEIDAHKKGLSTLPPKPPQPAAYLVHFLMPIPTPLKMALH